MTVRADRGGPRPVRADRGGPRPVRADRGAGATVNVTVNGVLRALPAEATVASVVGSLSGAPDGRGVAVALHGEVLPRARWAATTLTEGARMEIVAAVQGG